MQRGAAVWRVLPLAEAHRLDLEKLLLVIFIEAELAWANFSVASLSTFTSVLKQSRTRCAGLPQIGGGDRRKGLFKNLNNEH